MSPQPQSAALPATIGYPAQKKNKHKSATRHQSTQDDDDDASSEWPHRDVGAKATEKTATEENAPQKE
jgi:hypothetical protein